MKRFGEKLRTLRQQHGMSQGDVGDMLGVSQRHVSNMERGEKMPHVAMLLKISRIFDVSSDQLIKDELEL
ncbi:helix-turn-helix transcriptional regulator [Anaerolineales bacterium HSG6]|nr:helix-turn-helix transcriptional regulator [Anaerolineales bacterium HSG6]MDM8531420.1 helix-turn-helix transcriptional regulator [Anaerolineales bacterium HSG25]